MSKTYLVTKVTVTCVTCVQFLKTAARPDTIKYEINRRIILLGTFEPIAHVALNMLIVAFLAQLKFLAWLFRHPCTAESCSRLFTILCYCKSITNLYNIIVHNHS